MYSLNLLISTKKPKKAINNICQDFGKYYFYYYKDLLNYIEPVVQNQIVNIPKSAYSQFKTFDEFLNKIIECERLLYVTTNLTLNKLPKEYIQSVESDFSKESLELQLAYIIHPVEGENEPNIFFSSLQLLIQHHGIFEILAVRCCYDCIIQHLHNIYDKYSTVY